MRARVGPRGVSAYLDEAAREKLERDDRRARVLACLAELERSDPVTPAARKKAARLVRALTGT